jgi:hypothetical protein
MRKPWLDIPLSEYEGHMALPAVGQAEMLRRCASWTKTKRMSKAKPLPPDSRWHPAS